MESPGATLSAPAQTAAPGQTIVVGISFSAGGRTISGVQFDLQPAAPVALRVLPGAQLGASAKLIYTNELPNRVLRVLIVGTDAGALADGELARLVISVDAAATPGSVRIPIANALATDPDGNAVDVAASSVDLRLDVAPVFSAFAAGGVLNAASLLPGPVSPGEIISVFGGAGLAATTDVLFGGLESKLLYAAGGQINAIAPFGLDPATPVNIAIRGADRSLGSAASATAAVTPALFTASGSGVGQAAVLNADYSRNSWTNPAARGAIVILYGTGFGAVVPVANDGEPAAGVAPTALPVTATIAGAPAEVLYAGAAPGLVAGVVQINVRVPVGISPSDTAPVLLTIAAATTPPGVTLAVR
jgi:uncharacterized protein (TIGR03437 family)